MSAKCTSFFRQDCVRQHGAALMVMLVILVVGAAAILVGTLSSSSLQIERNKTTADALAKARNALIGYAVSDGNRPGELPCPDVNDDGMITLADYSGSNCASPIGRLPWKTLGLTELRDGNGEHLWYAVSKAFWANGSSAINSDTLGNLTVSGTTTVSNVIAIVFAPGAALSSPTQSRSTTQTAACSTTGTTVANSLCASNYLEGSNANLSTAATPNTAFQTAAASSTFNDQMIYITHDALLQPVETRIAREAKKCLDDYAASSSNRYPWAADDYDTTYTGNYNTFFGRIPVVPITTTAFIDNTGQTMLTAISNLQVALNAYSTSNNAATQAALLNAGQTLATAANNADNYSGTFQPYNYLTDQAQYAGMSAQNLANGGSSVSTVQNYINNTNTSLNYNGFIDSAMSETWPTNCVFGSSYWSYWQNEVFFQVTNGYRPGSSSSCGTSCLTINGSGNPAGGNGTYHAAVIVGRAHNASGSVTSNPPIYYLEGTNLHDSSSSSSTISKTFETYSPSGASYSSVNDLVVCLDGNNNCK